MRRDFDLLVMYLIEVMIAPVVYEVHRVASFDAEAEREVVVIKRDRYLTETHFMIIELKR